MNIKKYQSQPGVVAFNTNSQEQSQEDLCEFQNNLVYIVSGRTAKATKQRTNKQKQIQKMPIPYTGAVCEAAISGMMGEGSLCHGVCGSLGTQ